MNTKRTILSEKELNLIEEIISKYGLIVSFDQIYNLFSGKKDRQSLRKLVSKLTKNGWLIRIKKGVYAVASLESRGFLGIHSFKIAQVLVEDSYISFEAALQYYGMFDQMLKDIVSVSLKQFRTKTIQGINYRFVKVKGKMFSDWKEVTIDNYLVRIASKEKAILDLLGFQRTVYTLDLVLEKLKDYQNEFDFQKLQQLSLQYSKTVQKIVGFLLDKLSINSDYLTDHLKRDKSIGYMTKDSNKFNAKWRLYYLNRFDQD